MAQPQVVQRTKFNATPAFATTDVTVVTSMTPRCPLGFYVNQKHCKSDAGDVVRPLTALSHINVPVQWRAAQRTVRCNRLLGLRGPLVPQNNMRGLLRRCKFNAFVSQSPQVNAFEQSLSTT